MPRSAPPALRARFTLALARWGLGIGASPLAPNQDEGRLRPGRPEPIGRPIRYPSDERGAAGGGSRADVVRERRG